MINASELKIGDIISYKTNDNYTHLKYRIRELTEEKVLVTSIGMMEEYCIPIWIRKEQIVSKLEPLPVQYKEIKVKQEIKTYHPYRCPACHKDWGLTGIQDVIQAVYCKECVQSWVPAKHAPYKFDFWPTLISCENNGYGKEVRVAKGYTKNRTDIENLPCPEWLEFGKTYVVEIREKE